MRTPFLLTATLVGVAAIVLVLCVAHASVHAHDLHVGTTPSDLHHTVTSAGEAPLKVAVIGGGIGGSSFAWFLRQELAKVDDVEITLYEKNTKLGGRMSHTSFAGRDMELGASIFHLEVRLMPWRGMLFGSLLARLHVFHMVGRADVVQRTCMTFTTDRNNTHPTLYVIPICDLHTRTILESICSTVCQSTWPRMEHNGRRGKINQAFSRKVWCMGW